MLLLKSSTSSSHLSKIEIRSGAIRFFFVIMTKHNLNLDMRLSMAAELVPTGAALLDVGTDHGYLPTKLILEGKINTAGASDINKDPLSKAVNTAEKYGVSGKMSFYLSNGLESIPDICRYNCISICGMGGELISEILAASDHVRRPEVSLVLQPMSSAEELSVYLASYGYRIKDERIAFAAGKLYRVILAAYDGAVRSYTSAEHILGSINIEKGAAVPFFKELLKKNILKYRRICDGMKAGGLDFSEPMSVLRELFEIARRKGVEYDDR